MPAFLNMIHDYEEVKVKDGSLSWWPYVMGTFGTVTILIAIVCYSNMWNAVQSVTARTG